MGRKQFEICRKKKLKMDVKTIEYLIEIDKIHEKFPQMSILAEVLEIYNEKI